MINIYYYLALIFLKAKISIIALNILINIYEYFKTSWIKIELNVKNKYRII